MAADSLTSKHQEWAFCEDCQAHTRGPTRVVEEMRVGWWGATYKAAVMYPQFPCWLCGKELTERCVMVYSGNAGLTVEEYLDAG